jgi:hypothetical protein
VMCDFTLSRRLKSRLGEQNRPAQVEKSALSASPRRRILLL